MSILPPVMLTASSDRPGVALNVSAGFACDLSTMLQLVNKFGNSYLVVIKSLVDGLCAH